MLNSDSFVKQKLVVSTFRGLSINYIKKTSNAVVMVLYSFMKRFNYIFIQETLFFQIQKDRPRKKRKKNKESEK